jgi:hypothetical protein
MPGMARYDPCVAFDSPEHKRPTETNRRKTTTKSPSSVYFPGKSAWAGSGLVDGGVFDDGIGEELVGQLLDGGQGGIVRGAV